jgi:predicted NBD/HSP70 family sugar kinase
VLPDRRYALGIDPGERKLRGGLCSRLEAETEAPKERAAVLGPLKRLIARLLGATGCSRLACIGIAPAGHPHSKSRASCLRPTMAGAMSLPRWPVRMVHVEAAMRAGSAGIIGAAHRVWANG